MKVSTNVHKYPHPVTSSVFALNTQFFTFLKEEEPLFFLLQSHS